MSPATGASWSIKVSLVTDSHSVHVVEMTVGQSKREIKRLLK